MNESRQARIAMQEKMEALQEGVFQNLKERFPGVTSVDIGLRESNGQLMDELVWRIFVREKRSLGDLRSEEILPKEIAGIKTDVLKQREAVVCDWKYRPLWGGMGVANGTLGCLVTRNSDGLVHLLSNRHVLQGDLNSDIGQFVASCDCKCCVCDTLATLVDFRIGTSVGTHQVDAAIGRLAGQNGVGTRLHYTNNILGIGPVFGSHTTPLVAGDLVRKYGDTSGLTMGRVSGISVGGIIARQNPGQEPAITFTYNQQIEVTSLDNTKAMVKSGDSGSVFVNNLNQVIGLVFASDDKPETLGIHGYANSVANVISPVVGVNITFMNSALPGHPDTVPLSSITDLYPPIVTANPGNFLLKIEKRLNSTPEGQKFLQVVHENRREVLDLINDNREVKVAWNRYQGPSFIGHLMINGNNPSHQIPDQVEGYSLQNLLIKMNDVLDRHGSSKLTRALEDYAPVVFNFADQYQRQGFSAVDGLIDQGAFCPNCGTPKSPNLYGQ